MVSGGDALVEIKMAGDSPPDDLTVTRNGTSVRDAFHLDPSRHSFIGLVDGLGVGRNTLTARSGSDTAELELTNFPITGPIVSGPHLKPFACGTAESGLGEPLDADCSAVDEGRVLLQVHVALGGEQPVQAVGGSGVTPRRCGAGRHHRRPDGSLHRSRGVRHDRSRDLPDRHARWWGLEPSPDVHVRRRLRHPQHAGRQSRRRRADRRAARAGSCASRRRRRTSFSSTATISCPAKP